MTKKDESLAELQELMAEVETLETKELVLNRAAPTEVTTIEVAKYQVENKPLRDGSGTWVRHSITGHDLTDKYKTRMLFEGPEPQGKETEYALLFDRYSPKGTNYRKWSAARFVTKAEAIKQTLASLKALKAKGESTNDPSAA